MPTTTSRLGLSKPGTADIVDIAVLNNNSDIIDAKIGTIVCTSTTRPSTPFTGQMIFESDTQYTWVYSGSAWIRVDKQTLVVTSSTRPASPYVGQTIYESDTKISYVWNASAWNRIVTTEALTGQVAGALDNTVMKPYGPVPVADAAARDTLFPSPVQGNRVFRLDKMWEEVYFAIYNASTNPGGVNQGAGWYPVVGNLPYAKVTGSDTLTTTSSAYNWDTNVYQTDSGIHSTATNTERFVAPISGVYHIEGVLQTTGTTAVTVVGYYNGSPVYEIYATATGTTGASASVKFSGEIKMGQSSYFELRGTAASSATYSSVSNIVFKYVSPAYGSY